MRPLQSGPVIFTNQDLILTDTRFSAWYRFSVAELQQAGAQGESWEVLGCCYYYTCRGVLFLFALFFFFLENFQQLLMMNFELSFM